MNYTVSPTSTMEEAQSDTFAPTASTTELWQSSATEIPSGFPSKPPTFTPSEVPSHIPSCFPTNSPTFSPTSGPKQIPRLIFNIENNLTNQILIISLTTGTVLLCLLSIAICWLRRKSQSNSTSSHARIVEAEWGDNVSENSLLSGGRETQSRGYAYEKHLLDTYAMRQGLKSTKHGSGDDMQRLI